MPSLLSSASTEIVLTNGSWDDIVRYLWYAMIWLIALTLVG